MLTNNTVKFIYFILSHWNF